MITSNYDTAIQILTSVTAQALNHYNPDELVLEQRAVLYGLCAAVAILRDPPTQDGVVDIATYATAGLHYVTEAVAT